MLGVWNQAHTGDSLRNRRSSFPDSIGCPYHLVEVPLECAIDHKKIIAGKPDTAQRTAHAQATMEKHSVSCHGSSSIVAYIMPAGQSQASLKCHWTCRAFLGCATANEKAASREPCGRGAEPARVLGQSQIAPTCADTVKTRRGVIN
jgi:hypothetical protein